MENVRDDPMCNSVLAFITKEGPVTDSQIHGRFLRNRNAWEIDEILIRLQSAKKIACTMEPSGPSGGRPKRTWRPYEKSNEKTQAPGKHRVYVCLRFPSLTIGKVVKFQDGFYQTDSTEEQRFIEQSGEYNLSVRDITEVLREIPLSKRKKLYLSSQASVDIEYHPRLKTIEFETVADGLYLLVCEDQELARFIERSQSFHARETVEVPRTLVEAAGS